MIILIPYLVFFTPIPQLQSLTLLENLLKTGSDRVLNTMKDNVYIVKALTEFRFQDKDGKDQVLKLAKCMFVPPTPLMCRFHLQCTLFEASPLEKFTLR